MAERHPRGFGVKILVTGASGFIGASLTQRLADAGHHVVAVHHRGTPQENSDHVTWVRADLARPWRLPACDVVVHAAAAHPHTRPTPTPDEYVRANVDAARHLLDHARATRPSLLIALSSVSLYGRVSGEITEETAAVNADAYGRSKAQAERVLLGAGGLPVIALRLPGVLGRGQVTPWLGGVLMRSLRGEAVQIFNPAAPFNNATDPDEIARFAIDMIERGTNAPGGPVHLAARDPLTVGSAVRLVIERAGSSSAVAELPAARPSFSLSIRRLERTFGFTPDTTRAIIERFVDVNARGRIPFPTPGDNP